MSTTEQQSIQLSEIPRFPCGQDAINIVLACKPGATVAVQAELWAPPYEGNSSVSIYDGDDHYRAKSLRGAIVLFVETHQAKQAAGAANALQEISGAVEEQKPSEVSASQDDDDVQF